jgi:gluconokinase
MSPIPPVSRPALDAIVVMGVSGCGKSTVGRLLADSLGWPFVEGDDNHPPENIARMSAGIPLTDDDRRGWLDTLAGRIRAARATATPIVLSCSALKRRYRDRLRTDSPALAFVYLHGTPDTLRARMAARTGHFMPTGLLDSQFAALEPPAPDEAAVTVDVTLPPAEIARQALAALTHAHPSGFRSPNE